MKARVILTPAQRQSLYEMQTSKKYLTNYVAQTFNVSTSTVYNIVAEIDAERAAAAARQVAPATSTQEPLPLPELESKLFALLTDIRDELRDARVAREAMSAAMVELASLAKSRSES